MDTNKLLPLLAEMGVFVKVVESGSFSKAASLLGVAPSSISRTITRLEQALEEKLLERTTRNMRLTSTGQVVFLLCRDMLESAQMAVSAAHTDKSEISGLLRVAAPKALSKQVLMPMVLGFIRAHPKVSLQLKVADHFIDPIGDEIDILIHITHKPILGLVSKPLGHCKMTLCATPEYLAQHGIPAHPEELPNYNCICLGESPKDSVWEFKHNNQRLLVNIKGSFIVNHSEIRREAVLSGMGISIFPDFVIKPYIASGELVELLTDWHIGGNYQGDIIAQYAQSKYIPNQVRGFIQYLTECFAEREKRPIL